MDIPITKDKILKIDMRWPLKKGSVEKKLPRSNLKPKEPKVPKSFRGPIGINHVKRAFRELGTGFHL